MKSFMMFPVQLRSNRLNFVWIWSIRVDASQNIGPHKLYNFICDIFLSTKQLISIFDRVISTKKSLIKPSWWLKIIKMLHVVMCNKLYSVKISRPEVLMKFSLSHLAWIFVNRSPYEMIFENVCYSITKTEKKWLFKELLQKTNCASQNIVVLPYKIYIFISALYWEIIVSKWYQRSQTTWFTKY